MASREKWTNVRSRPPGKLGEKKSDNPLGNGHTFFTVTTGKHREGGTTRQPS